MKIKYTGDVQMATNRNVKQVCIQLINNTICHRVGDQDHARNLSISEILRYRSEIRDLSKIKIATHLFCT